MKNTKLSKLSCVLAGLGFALAIQAGTAVAQSEIILNVEFQGPGGHSNGAYGRTNAVHAAGRTIADIIDTQDKTAYNIVNFNGGNSVNSIASDASYQIRLKAASDSALATLKGKIEASIEKGVKAENDFRGVADGDLTGGVPANIRYTITEQPTIAIHEVVEFYHADFDHYFLTLNTQEISDLDTGVHTGWARTGQSFYAYGANASDGNGTSVCRFYGLPEFGLDTHFFTAPSEACAVSPDVTSQWLLETTNAFEVTPTTNNACPTGTSPIYRLWNGRADSNHRYVTTEALVEEMVNDGFTFEGPGWLKPIMCSAPAP